MSRAWAVVAVVVAVSLTLRVLAPLALGGRTLPPRLRGALSLTAPALMAAMVVTLLLPTDDGPHGQTLWTRLAGVGAGALALALRRSLLVALVIAVAVTALLRLVLF